MNISAGRVYKYRSTGTLYKFLSVTDMGSFYSAHIIRIENGKENKEYVFYKNEAAMLWETQSKLTLISKRRLR